MSEAFAPAPDGWIRPRRRKFNRVQRALQKARLEELQPDLLTCRLSYEPARDCHWFEYGDKKIRMDGEMPNLRVGEDENELTANQALRLWELVDMGLRMRCGKRWWWFR